MGLQDRDYYRRPPGGGLGAVQVWSVTTWLIVINIAVFVLDAVLWRAASQFRGRSSWSGGVWGPLSEYGYFSIEKVVMEGQVWRLLTYQFLHLGLWHLALNMIGLWLFGPVVELNLGTRRYSFFYLLCGIAGPLMYAALWGLGILMPDGPRELVIGSMKVPMVGASAAIFGVLLAAAHRSPDRPINIFFMDIKLKYLAWIMVGIAAYGVLVNEINAGGAAAHLGGALAGFILIRQERVLDVVLPRRTVRGRKVKDWSRDRNR